VLIPTSISSRARSFVSSGALIPILGVFLAVLGSKLWLLRAYGNDVPFWDQWNAEGLSLYKPMLEKGFWSVDWLAAHNEHRILIPRLSSALILFANMQWDPLVQTCWEAFCAASIAAILCAMIQRLLPQERQTGLIWALILLGMGLPYGWENTLTGFQTPFYYLIIISLLMFYFSAFRGILTRNRSIVICFLGVMSLLTLASGALSCVAVACGLVMRLIFSKDVGYRRIGGLALVMLVLAIVGFATTPTIPYHESLRAQNLHEAIDAFKMAMGWPSHFGLVIWLPFFIWLIRTLWQRKIDASGLFLVSLAAFVVLNMAALATARAASVHDFAIDSRYTDIAWFGWLVNLISVVMLARATPNGRSERLRVFASVAYFVFASSLLLLAGRIGLDGAASRAGIYATESENTRTYVMTGNYAALANKPPLQIPFPSSELLRDALDDPTIRALLPPGIRGGVLHRTGVGLDDLTHDGLVLTGVPPMTPPAPAPDLGDFYGTWSSAEGNTNTARYVSAPITAQGTRVRALVSGYLGQPGLSLYLEDVETGRRANLAPKRAAGGKWVVVTAGIPGPVYRLVAEDTAKGERGWFGFTDPVELGRLRMLADALIHRGDILATLGVLLFVASALVFPIRRGPITDDGL
jgi:hypothetical protein